MLNHYVMCQDVLHDIFILQGSLPEAENMNAKSITPSRPIGQPVLFAVENRTYKIWERIRCPHFSCPFISLFEFFDKCPPTTHVDRRFAFVQLDQTNRTIFIGFYLTIISMKFELIEEKVKMSMAQPNPRNQMTKP